MEEKKFPLLYMAPMEGITGHVYRSAHHKVFGDIDKYFTPFVGNPGLSKKELRDLSFENNAGMEVVPQILTNHADVFLEISKVLADMGYGEVNLNIGCPSGTVTAKGRGAGFLRTPDKLEAFLEEVFAKCELKISVKSRVGYSDIEEWQQLWDILCKFPFSERIIHARLREDFYREPARPKCYDYALDTLLDSHKKGQSGNLFKDDFSGCLRKMSQAEKQVILNTLCYNGDILTIEQYRQFEEQFSDTKRYMLGRGLIGNPGLAGEIKRGQEMSKESLATFLDYLEEGYFREIESERNAIWRLVEMWSYLKVRFPEGDKIFKKIRKCKSGAEYYSIVKSALQEI